MSSTYWRNELRKVFTTLAVLVALSLTACAQNTVQGNGEQFKQPDVSEHMQMMQDMTKEMYQELREMMKDMKGGDVTPEKMKQIHEHLGRITTMISRMSSFEDVMLKQMDEMKHDPSMKSPAK
jgi:predicted small secreted protein